MPEEIQPFGDDTSTVQELMQRPEDVHKLIIAKRKANAEAKKYREQLEAAAKQNQEIENLQQKIGELHQKRIGDLFKIEALKAGIRPDRLEPAAKIAELNGTENQEPQTVVSNAIKELEEGFPELFQTKSPPPEVDNAGFSRAKPNVFASAKSSGDALGMLKALRKK